MKDFQERVVVERNELKSKIEKLEVFIASETFKSLDPEDASLLTNQQRVMTEYVRILDARIKRFVSNGAD